METSSTRSQLPKIKPRFFLRRWVDRVAVDCIRRARAIPMTGANYRRLSEVPLLLSTTPLLLAGAGCLAGIFFHPSNWTTLCLLAAGLTWPVRWALGPWVRVDGEDECTVRALVPNQYQLIQDFSSPEQLEQIVEWALQDPYFDTRHLMACMEDDHTAFRGGRFAGHNALDLFDGLVGRRVSAIQQGEQLETITQAVDNACVSRRRL